MTARIYHNPKCSKSRAALALLEARGVALEIVEYLRDPPSRATLAALHAKLGGEARAMIRTDEPEFKTFAHERATDAELLDFLAANPRLLQRPIVESGDEARIGRPPERVLELFE